MEPVRVTVLIENETTRPDLRKEHGLSLLVEAGGRMGLLDTGRTGAVVQNARELGVDLRGVGWIVLSHGHYDHANGLRAVLRECTAATVYAHPEAFRPKYAGAGGVPLRAIGMDMTAGEVKEAAAALECTHEPVHLTPGVLTTGEIDRTTDIERPAPIFYTKGPNGTRRDTFPDDTALVVRAAQGTVVLLGCAHAGVINTLEHVKRLTGGPVVHAVIGGMHLGDASRERIDRTVAALHEAQVQLVAPLHCTGEKAVHALRDSFGDQCVAAPGGTTLTF
jgi:7,8-dihydropterin-6-yl-methyl-4-(beta-D-ribofuranosyl)aminobenzene 5'-phosphate synthase